MERKGPILFYEPEYYAFSNFSSFKVEYRESLWMTSEHAYQAAKFNDEFIREEIKNARSAFDAKRIAKLHTDNINPFFEEQKLFIMEEILRAKCIQHEYVLQKLLETGEREIIENSPTDSFWGWGPNKDGENHLGKIWMKLRNEFKG